MTDAVPSGGVSVEAVAQRLRQILDEAGQDRADIAQMADASLRQWLSGVTSRIAASLGVAAASVAAVFSDACTMALNAKDAFLSSYERERSKRRQVQRRPRA
ncbi:hypothetical protein ACH5A2_18265 [Streptomyces collinus]|uniref:hypothetical protein n=1 Tax=Streptomyces collinus TaxID=42684 RepID=UPI0037965842